MTKEDSLRTYEFDKHFIIYPDYISLDNGSCTDKGRMVAEGFEYDSGSNTEWLSVDALKEKLRTDISVH